MSNLEPGTRIWALPRIYPLTDTRLSGLSHAGQVGQLIAGGATMVQLREKHTGARDFYEDAEKALEIARRHNVKIIINDRVDIAFTLGADGVHLGQDDLPPEEARKILGDDAIIGYSTHSLDQALEAAKLPIDYIAFGPVYDTTTKDNPDKTVGLDGLKWVREAVPGFPLVAIGGINSANLRPVFEAGADSAAIISDLYASPLNISEKMAALIDLSRPVGKQCLSLLKYDLHSSAKIRHNTRRQGGSARLTASYSKSFPFPSFKYLEE